MLCVSITDSMVKWKQNEHLKTVIACHTQTLLICNYSVYYYFYEVDVLKEKKERK